MTPAMTTKILSEFARLPQLEQPQNDESDLLTSRELEVMRYLRLGATNREIAEQLFIAENTVKNHVRNILAKYHLNSRRQAINYPNLRSV
ncbi:MAG: LuxR C-terminal-related transcriptional regulator [Caldilineaceae bacterium]